MMKNVSIETAGATLGEIRFSLSINGRPIKTSATPKVKSNCAKITDIKPDGDDWVITYLYNECYDDPDNKITVRSNGASKDFWFDINADKVEIFVNGDINLTAGNGNGTEVSGCKCFIPIVSKFDSPFVVEKVVLNFGNESPIIVENINQRFSGKGNHDFNIGIEQPLDKATYTQKKHQFINGTIFYKSEKSKESNAYRFYSNKITTSW